MATIVADVGDGNWSAGGTWIGGVAPTAADDAVLGIASGSVTVDSGGTRSCRSLDCTGYTGTLTMNANLQVGTSTPGTGNIALKLVSGMTMAGASGWNFISNSSTQQTVDFGGKTVNAISFTGTGSSYLLAGAITSSGGFTHTAGIFNTNNYNITCGAFQTSSTTTRTLTLGSSSISCTSWSVTGSNLTFNSNTSTITLTSGSSSFTGAGLTYYNVTFSSASTTVQVIGANTFNDLAVTGTTTKVGQITFTANQTVNGTFTTNGNSVINRITISSDTIGTARTLTCAAVSFSNVNFNDITGAGAANWNLSAITGLSGDCLGNSGITFTASATQTATGTASFTWSTHGWTSRVPLPQDNVVISNAFVAGRTITNDMPYMGSDVTFSCTGNPVLSTTVSSSLYGSLTLATGMTHSGSQSFVFRGRGAQTMQSSGVGLSALAFFFGTFGGSLTLLDNFSTNNTVTLSSGTLKLSGFQLACSVFNTSNNAVVKQLTFGGGTLQLSSTGIVLNILGSNFTVDKSGGGAITIGTASASGRSINGAGLSWPTVNYIVASSTGSLTFIGSSSYDVLNFSDASNARSLLFTAGTTNTFVIFNVQGTAGKLMTIDSPTAATHTLSKASGTVSCDYLSVKNSVATGGAGWYAGANSTNVSGNSGWIFSAAISTFTQSAISRIAINKTYTQTSVARIAINKTKTQSAIARIVSNLAFTQSAIARIVINSSVTQSAIARISQTRTKTQLATARISQVLVRIQTAIALISVVQFITQTAIARITITKSFIQTATARVIASRQKQQTATARVVVVKAKTQTATAKVIVGVLYDSNIDLDAPETTLDARVESRGIELEVSK